MSLAMWLQLLVMVPAVTANLPICTKRWEYCIVGAGPGGLQGGQFMMQRGWDYVIVERNSSASSFFEKYPIHRQLISLNKRFTGRDDEEFNLRHDWNSLVRLAARSPRIFCK